MKTVLHKTSIYQGVVMRSVRVIDDGVKISVVSDYLVEGSSMVAWSRPYSDESRQAALNEAVRVADSLFEKQEAR